MIQEKNIHYYHELQDWKRSVDFYLEELSVFNDRVAEVTEKNTNRDTLARVEHFQNQFILQQEQFELLRHDIRSHKEKIESIMAAKNDAQKGSLTPGQQQIRDRLLHAEKIFADTKHAFYNFLSAVL